MLDINIAEISATSGNNNDGVVRGDINRSLLVGSYNNLLLAANVYAHRKDTSGGSVVYTDVSAEAVSNVDDAFLPWGTDTDFGTNDEIWIADGDKDIDEIYVHITTPGVWVGTGLEILESVDGETLTPVQDLVDNSDGLRASAGIHKITFSANAANRKSIAPEFGATKRKYIILRPSGFVSKTTSPKLKMIWLVGANSSNTWSDFTSITNDTMTDSTFTEATMFPLVGSEAVHGFSGPTIGVYDAVYRGIPNVFDVTVEYLASDNTWKVLPNYTDPSNNFENAPLTKTETPTYYLRKWSLPSDWVVKTLTFAPSTTQVSAYWVRRRITTVASYGPIPIYMYRRRSLSFGSGLAYGIYHKVSSNYTHVTFDIGQPSSTATVVAFTNAITGQSQSVTIPANTISSGALTGGRLDFSAALNIGAGEMLIINHVSGGTLQDVELHLAKE